MEFKGNVKLTEKLYIEFYGDVGTGESDLTWQAMAGIGYKFKWFDVVATYRYLDWDFDDNSAIDDLNISGIPHRSRMSRNVYAISIVVLRSSMTHGPIIKNSSSPARTSSHKLFMTIPLYLLTLSAAAHASIPESGPCPSSCQLWANYAVECSRLNSRSCGAQPTHKRGCAGAPPCAPTAVASTCLTRAVERE